MKNDDKANKLVLKRETLIELKPDQLDGVNGGFIRVTVGNSCCIFNSCNKGGQA